MLLLIRDTNSSLVPAGFQNPWDDHIQPEAEVSSGIMKARNWPLTDSKHEQPYSPLWPKSRLFAIYKAGDRPKQNIG